MSSHDSEGAGNTKENSVVVKLIEAVVHQESTRSGINVRPGVANLTGGFKNVGDDSVASLNKLHEVIILNVLVSKLELTHETRIGLTEDGMTVAWDNLA